VDSYVDYNEFNVYLNCHSIFQNALPSSSDQRGFLPAFFHDTGSVCLNGTIADIQHFLPFLIGMALTIRIALLVPAPLNYPDDFES